MPQQLDTFSSRDTVIDYHWPVLFESDNSNQPTQILIAEPWYDFAQSVYDWCQQFAKITAFVDVSLDSFTQFELLEMTEAVVKLGTVDVSIFLLHVVIYSVIEAVKRGIELSKFKLHPGGWGARIGWTPLGAILYRKC